MPIRYRPFTHLPVPISFLEFKPCIIQKSGKKLITHCRSFVSLLTESKLQLNFGMYNTPFTFAPPFRVQLPLAFTGMLSPLGIITGASFSTLTGFSRKSISWVMYSVEPESITQSSSCVNLPAMLAFGILSPSVATFVLEKCFKRVWYCSSVSPAIVAFSVSCSAFTHAAFGFGFSCFVFPGHHSG
ncbi:hypothetical protein HanXRQr2_Chr12g0522161 [Helianthus annuus]|uniref:Uncharacterized protein n=1 Tax=Helianthus annuus TaxID=4232 RepID=A0A9K3HCX6_HELAN|nr:hypothetical protein HanXRQr2_Chr12g0522161 [Helianthus annuus]